MKDGILIGTRQVQLLENTRWNRSGRSNKPQGVNSARGPFSSQSGQILTNPQFVQKSLKLVALPKR